MLRGNLSTRPFYNEGLVTLMAGVIAVVAIALAAFNVMQLVSLSKQQSELTARISRDRDEARRIMDAAGQLQKTVDRSRLSYLAGATREANELIDQRTFSWTVFFGVIEKTLPLDVRLVGVSPRVERGHFAIQMKVVAKNPTVLAQFIDGLADTGMFYDVLSAAQTLDEDGTDIVTIQASYLPPALVPVPAPAPKAPGKTTKGQRP